MAARDPGGDGESPRADGGEPARRRPRLVGARGRSHDPAADQAAHARGDRQPGAQPPGPLGRGAGRH